MARSVQWRTTADRIAAVSIIHGIGPQKYERNFRTGLCGSCGSWFGPLLEAVCGLGIAQPLIGGVEPIVESFDRLTVSLTGDGCNRNRVECMCHQSSMAVGREIGPCRWVQQGTCHPPGVEFQLMRCRRKVAVWSN